MFHLFRIYHNADNGGTSTQGGTAAGNTQGGNNGGTQTGSTSDQGNTQGGNNGGTVDASFQRLLGRNEDAIALARQLFTENYTARDRIRQLEQSMPAEGAVVLAGEEAQRWAAYTQLGQPAELQTAIQTLQQLQADQAQQARTATISTAAQLAGFEADVLAELAGELPIEIRETDKKDAAGNAIRAAFVIKDDKTAQPLAEYAQATWPKFMAALKPNARPGAQLGTPPRTGSTQTSTSTQTGTQAPQRPRVRL